MEDGFDAIGVAGGGRDAEARQAGGRHHHEGEVQELRAVARVEHRQERQQRDLLPRERRSGRQRHLLERSGDAGARRRRASPRPVPPDGGRRRLRSVSVARRSREGARPVEPGAPRGGRQSRRALAQRRERGRVPAGPTGSGGQRECAQVRPAPSLLLLYNLCYMPTLGLANSLAFHHIQSQEKQFPLIRVFGTAGWIVAGLFISFVLGPLIGVVPEPTALPIYTTATASVLLGLFSFLLPHTPPPGAGQRVSLRSILGLDALAQLGDRAFYVFIAASLLLCIPLAAYYNFTQIFLGDAGITRIAATQSLGQMSEVIFMLLMPVFFVRLGVKRMLMVGMAAWVVRYALFAVAAPSAVLSLILIAILLHGVCYDFFFVTGQIYVDKKSTPAIRGQAQGFLVLVTYGVGMLIGAQVAGNVYNRFLGGAASLTLERWPSFWMLPAGFAAVVLLLFAALFRPGGARAPQPVAAD